MSRWLLIAVALTVLPAHAAVRADDPAERARTIIDQGGYQTDLPGMDAPSADESSDHATAMAPRWRIPIPAVAGEIATSFAWVLVGALLVAALIGLVVSAAAALGRRRERPRDGLPEIAGGQTLLDRPPDARSLEAMIEQGDWSAAVHTLLCRAFTQIEHRARRSLPISSTSRELLGRPEIGEHRRHLAVLVAAVEHSRFGGMMLGEGDYQRAREAYDALGMTGSGGS